MNRRMASVFIEGDLIDSFVYSGALFLVDVDGVLRTYPWKELVFAAYLRSNGSVPDYVRSLLTADEEIGTASVSGEERAVEDPVIIDQRFLSNFERASINFGCWPTDIDIYSNNLYVASENGATKQRFSWDQGNIREFDEPIVIWDEMAFRISPNSMNRVAIAAGTAGLIAVRSNNRKDTTQIFDTPCGDCEWKNSTLIANTTSGAFIAEFEDIPKYNILLGSQEEYWNIVNSIKSKAPNSTHRVKISERHALASWTGGDRLFAIDDTFVLYVKQVDSLSEDSPLQEFQVLATPKIVSDGESRRFLSSRTGAFGTVVEFSDALFQLSEEGIEKISDHPVRWRVFPRARNFANHLHVIEENGLSVKAFGRRADDSSFDRFGFALGTIDGP